MATNYALPQSCPSELDPHLPAECRDPEHAILAMSDEEFSAYGAEIVRRNPELFVQRCCYCFADPALVHEVDCPVAGDLRFDDAQAARASA